MHALCQKKDDKKKDDKKKKGDKKTDDKKMSKASSSKGKKMIPKPGFQKGSRLNREPEFEQKIICNAHLEIVASS